MKITVKTKIQFSATKVWNLLRFPKNIELLAAPEINFHEFNWADGEFEENICYVGKLSSKGKPTIEYTIEFQEINSQTRYSRSTESGGPIRKWVHERTVEETSEVSCRIVDRFEIAAGLYTFPLCFFVKRHYGLRYKKLSQLPL